MRKRSEAGPTEEAPAPRVLGNRLPMEDDPSAMSIALKKRGYDIGPSVVRDWATGPLHLVAMWLNGDLSEDDIPEAIRGLKKLPSAEEVVSSVVAGSSAVLEKLAEEKRSTRPRTQRESLTQPGSAMVPGKLEETSGELLLVTPPDTLTVTWGSEKIYPSQGSYSNFEVGMLSTTVHLAPGEDKEKRARSEYATLAKLAEDFREQKRVSFLRFVKGIKDDAKDAK